MEYDFELDKAVMQIKKEKAKIVCIQFPDGLKPRATEIAKKLEELTKTTIIIWLDSCFGACDIPLELKNLKVDLIIQFGHSPWPFWKDKTIEV